MADLRCAAIRGYEIAEGPFLSACGSYQPSTFPNNASMVAAPSKAICTSRSATFFRVAWEGSPVAASQVAAAPDRSVKPRAIRNTSVKGSMVISVSERGSP